MVIPAIGISGQTSVAPNRGCSPLWGAHIDNLGSFFKCLKSSFNHLIGCAHKCNNGAVGRFSGINIQQTNPINRLNTVSDLFDNCHITAFAKIGDAFDKLLHINLYFNVLTPLLTRKDAQN
jgi:hypothetical protein